MNKNIIYTEIQLNSILFNLNPNQKEIKKQILSMLSIMKIKNINLVQFGNYITHDELKNYIKKLMDDIKISDNKDYLSNQLHDFINLIPFNYISEKWVDEYSENLIKMTIKNIMIKYDKNNYYFKIFPNQN